MIGVILPDISNIFYGKLLKGIDNVARQRGYSVIYCDSGENLKHEKAYYDFLSEKNVCGLTRKVKEVRRKSLPKLLDFWTEKMQEANFVCPRKRAVASSQMLRKFYQGFESFVKSKKHVSLFYNFAEN